jgi:hypothetical protein
MKRSYWAIKIVVILSFFTIELIAKPSVSIDSLSGNAEIQRAGTIEWKKLSKETKLLDNDIIKVNDSGMAFLRWPDGSQTFVHQKSQILITLFQKKNENKVLANATIMFGAAFFVVKKMFPRDLSEEMRVYTPTAVISLRGTSFLIGFDSTLMSTNVKMFNGLVSVKNVVKNISILLATPYQSTIQKDIDPTAPKALLQDDIDSLKAWVPATIVENEISKQIDDSKKVRSELLGDVEEKCVITKFTNTSAYTGPWNISQEITHQFATLLRRNLTRIVVMITDSIVKDPLKTAKALNARFCISGTIDTFDITKYAKLNVQGDEYHESVIAKVSLKLHLFDINKNSEVVNKSFVTDFPGSNTLDNNWDTLHKKAFNFNDTAFTHSIIGVAVQKSIDQGVRDVTKGIQMQ